MARPYWVCDTSKGAILATRRLMRFPHSGLRNLRNRACDRSDWQKGRWSMARPLLGDRYAERANLDNPVVDALPHYGT